MTKTPVPQGKNAQLLTIKLEKMVYGGDALGRLPDGRAVFVPFCLPGETVKVRVVSDKRTHARAALVEVMEAAPERIAPRCQHFGICGGCAYQHLPYSKQLQVKTDILREALVRTGKIADPPIKPIVPSPREWYYRNNVQFHLADDGRLGYMDAGGRNVMAIKECHLPEAELNDTWPRLVFDGGSVNGVERVSLRLGNDKAAMLVLESESPQVPELELESGLSVIHLTANDEVVMAGDPALTMTVKDRNFLISAASFFQVNTGVAEKMVDHLLEHLPLSNSTTLLDVYCGAGLFSAFFAGRVLQVIGVESSSAACEDFAANLDEFENVSLYEAPAEIVLPSLVVHPQVVILDPPRAGLDVRALEALLRLEPEHIAYVSCDPPTLARDLARMTYSGYRMVQVTPFDMFPQTHSIESISILEKG